VFSIEFTHQADKALARMPRNTRELVMNKIEDLALDPFGTANVKKLVGQPGWRLRVGDWRVIYDVEQVRLTVRVLRVAARGGAYQ